MYEKKSRHSQLRIWRVRFWGMSFGDIWWRSTSKTQIRWLILATFIPLAPNVASMELPWDAQRNRQKGQIHSTSTLHQKTVSKWWVYTVDRWMIHVKHQCILLIYPILDIIIYIYISTILLILYIYMNSVSIGRSPPYLPSFFHVVKSRPSNTVYLVAFWSWRNWSLSTAEDAMVMYLQTAPRSHTDSHPQEWCVHHVSATVVLASALRRKKL